MNNDAKFFFFLSGFFGFVFFYTFSMCLDRDPINSLIYGTAGSLFFSILGRTLLISALRKVQVSKGNIGGVERVVTDADRNDNGDADDAKVLNSSLKANIEAASPKAPEDRTPAAEK